MSEPAFPFEYEDERCGRMTHTGMTLRDYFAGQALVGLLASGPHDCDEHGLAHDAYLHADALLAEREGK